MATPGLDLAALAGYVPSAGPLRARLIAGGRSNLTYEVTDGTGTWIVRRPPLGEVLASAHDMGREYRVLTALRDTAVPVPRTYAFCADPGVIGAPFYVMAKAEGVPFRTAAELAPRGRARVRRISEAMVDTLATLHAVDPDAVGLHGFGRPEGFLARQVHRWRVQLEHSPDRAAADQLHARLAAAVPAESRHSVVHGDFRLDNLLVDEHDRITALLDWEMATLGDPLTDLALLHAYDWIARNDRAGALGDAPAAPGFLDPHRIAARYGCDRDLGWYHGLAFLKLAAVFAGIHHRYVNGQTVGDGFATAGTLVPGLLAAGLDVVSAPRGRR
ncbi:MAG: phosphotransferase [Actinophytocola sp.]|uniref:phosphotransferase family protein n=1 Tax=Actinophytocola sp. TaxID=1872138 RepID=UPI0013298F10|nr:phosphotransferase family protein [Actinophytocola sp.]MPZ81923.1 phosphotransferase [Actinophytocola sp.]